LCDETYCVMIHIICVKPFLVWNILIYIYIYIYIYMYVYIYIYVKHCAWNILRDGTYSCVKLFLVWNILCETYHVKHTVCMYTYIPIQETYLNQKRPTDFKGDLQKQTNKRNFLTIENNKRDRQKRPT